MAFTHLILCRDGKLILKVLNTCVCGKFDEQPKIALSPSFILMDLPLSIYKERVGW